MSILEYTLDTLNIIFNLSNNNQSSILIEEVDNDINNNSIYDLDFLEKEIQTGNFKNEFKKIIDKLDKNNKKEFLNKWKKQMETICFKF